MKPVREVITRLGETRGRPPHRTFGIRQADRLHHFYVVGQTGTGKSTLLQTMMMQDYSNGQGFCLIDPHGDLAASMAEQCGDGCFCWNAADLACPYGYNPLTTVSAAYRPLVVSGLIDTLKKQWADAWGARMEHLLRYSLFALLEHPGSTLQDVIPLFLDKGYRARVLATITDPIVKRFWDVEYRTMNFKTAVDGVAPIANKLGAFLAHPVVRKAVCDPAEPLRFRQIMDEGKVLIINLARGRLGGDVSNILGGLIVSSLSHAAYSRENIPQAERQPFFLYIDEFQSFTTEAFAEVLSGMRKYAVGLAISHQHTSQLDTNTLEAILGNVGTLMVFRVGATDASLLAKQLASDVPTPRDLINLPNYQAFTKIMIEGMQSDGFSATTHCYKASLK